MNACKITNPPPGSTVGDQYGRKIAKALINSSVEHLDAVSCGFGPKTAAAFANMLAVNSKLKYVNLSSA